jgi:ketosteroid isomerase-like protein
MPQSIADRFMDALQEAERSRSPEPLVELFAEDAEATSLARSEPLSGRRGVHQFWSEYLHAFAEIRSEFTSVFEADEGAVLEWVSEGKLPDGTPVSYRGVSVLETDGRHVLRFRTYFDSSVFLPAGAKQGTRSAG